MGRRRHECGRAVHPRARGGVFVSDSQVTLYSVIANWQRNADPERSQESFPSLPLVAIYGAITDYREHKDELDASLCETEELLATHEAAVEAEHPAFVAVMRARRDAYRARRDAYRARRDAYRAERDDAQSEQPGR